MNAALLAWEQHLTDASSAANVVQLRSGRA
jgi:hypothetical protein